MVTRRPAAPIPHRATARRQRQFQDSGITAIVTTLRPAPPAYQRRDSHGRRTHALLARSSQPQPVRRRAARSPSMSREATPPSRRPAATTYRSSRTAFRSFVRGSVASAAARRPRPTTRRRDDPDPGPGSAATDSPSGGQENVDERVGAARGWMTALARRSARAGWSFVPSGEDDPAVAPAAARALLRRLDPRVLRSVMTTSARSTRSKMTPRLARVLMAGGSRWPFGPSHSPSDS